MIDEAPTSGQIDIGHLPCYCYRKKKRANRLVGHLPGGRWTFANIFFLENILFCNFFLILTIISLIRKWILLFFYFFSKISLSEDKGKGSIYPVIFKEGWYGYDEAYHFMVQLIVRGTRKHWEKFRENWVGFRGNY